MTAGQGIAGEKHARNVGVHQRLDEHRDPRRLRLAAASTIGERRFAAARLRDRAYRLVEMRLPKDVLGGRGIFVTKNRGVLTLRAKL